MKAKRFDLQLVKTKRKTKTVSARALPKGIEVTIYRYGGGRERRQSKRCSLAPQVNDLVVDRKTQVLGVQRTRHPERGLNRPRSGMGGPHRDRSQSTRHQGEKGLVPLETASSRAIAKGRDEGVTKLLFDDSPEVHANGGQGKILGGGMVGTRAT